MASRWHPAPQTLAAGIAAILVAGCSEPATTPTRSFNPAVLTNVAAAVSDRHVFVMHTDVIPADFADAVAAAGGTIVRVHAEIGVAIVQGLSDESAAMVAQSRGFVERDVAYRAAPAPDEIGAAVLADALATDSTAGVADVAQARSPLLAAFLAMQWNMRQISAPQAWVTRPHGDRRVRVAIIDTGLDPEHIDQRGLIDEASSIAFVPTTSPPFVPLWADDHFHGTHVGAQVVTNNIGTAGVAPEVTLIAIKVADVAGRGLFADVIAGLIHAANVRADVANLSLRFPFRKTGLGPLVAAMNRAVNYANRHDVLVVSAAGNENIDLQHDENLIYVPCESGTGICISSTGPTDTKSSFSNYGASAIDVAAPGGELGPPPTHFILGPCSSRSMVFPQCRTRVQYLFTAGTSQATPHVSGAAAYLDAQYAGALTPAQLEWALQQCSDDIGKPGTDQFYGRGRINAFKTVNEVECNNSGSSEPS
jgi:lantibiotic leader peptide-processing serine protease